MKGIKVGILGAGITGLLAAEALHTLGIDYQIMDREPTKPGGGFAGLHYLHDACGMNLGRGVVFNFVAGYNPRIGTLPHEQYAEKVGLPVNNSMERLKTYEVVYDMEGAHQKLLIRHGHKIMKMEADSEILDKLVFYFDRVISTIPLWALFPEANCPKQEVGLIERLPALEGVFQSKPNFVVYNVNMKSPWYRASRIFGEENMELARPFPTGSKTYKIFDTDFVLPEEYQGKLLLMGRYGTWKRSYLAHHAYYETLRRFA